MEKQNETPAQGGEVEAVEQPKRVIKVNISKLTWADHRLIRAWSRGELPYFEQLDLCDRLVEGIDDLPMFGTGLATEVLNAVIQTINEAQNPTKADSGN